MENRKEKTSAVETLKQNAGAIAMLAIAVVAFYLAYSQFAASTPEKATTVNGITIIAKGGVKAALAGLLSPQVIATQVILDSSNDTRPCKVPMQTESIYGLAKSGKNVTLQLLVRDANYCLQRAGSNSSRQVECAKPQLIVEDGDCNCVKADSKKQAVVISGKEDWLCANGPNVREILIWALAKG